MIPKIIHYCWFGGGEMSELGQKCLESWSRFCPDFEIVRWDESNFDVNSIPYTKQAYEQKKFAFVSDYARLDIIYRFGGIYLDTDVELLKPLEALLPEQAFMGFGCTGGVNTGLGFGAQAGLPIIKTLRDDYLEKKFLTPQGEPNTTPCVNHQTALLETFGLKNNNEKQTVEGITVYPMEYFCPMHYLTGIVNITDNTYSIHHYESTHWSKAAKDGMLRLRGAYKKYGRLGGKLYAKSRWIRAMDILFTEGLAGIKKRR